MYTGVQRNNALTIFYVAIPVGSALGYLLGGIVEHAWNWRSAFAFAGAPGVVLAVLLLAQTESENNRSGTIGNQLVLKFTSFEHNKELAIHE